MDDESGEFMERAELACVGRSEWCVVNEMDGECVTLVNSNVSLHSVELDVRGPGHFNRATLC